MANRPSRLSPFPHAVLKGWQSGSTSRLAAILVIVGTGLTTLAIVAFSTIDWFWPTLFMSISTWVIWDQLLDDGTDADDGEVSPMLYASHSGSLPFSHLPDEYVETVFGRNLLVNIIIVDAHVYDVVLPNEVPADYVTFHRTYVFNIKNVSSSKQAAEIRLSSRGRPQFAVCEVTLAGASLGSDEIASAEEVNKHSSDYYVWTVTVGPEQTLPVRTVETFVKRLVDDDVFDLPYPCQRLRYSMNFELVVRRAQAETLSGHEPKVLFMDYRAGRVDWEFGEALLPYEGIATSWVVEAQDAEPVS